MSAHLAAPVPRRATRHRAAYALLALLSLAIGSAHGDTSIAPQALRELGFHQHPGTRLPLGAAFIDADGRGVRLGDLFKGKPAIVVLEYLRCRTLCGVVLEQTAAVLGRVPLRAGRDYQVLAISIDPRDTAADARAARARYAGVDAAGWHFLTGSPAAIRSVAAAVGFSYRYDPVSDQYAHAAGITVTSPHGIIVRYLLGVDYRPLDLRLALTEAIREQPSTPIADLLLLCYCYDPATGRYSLAIARILQLLCAASALALVVLVLRQRRARA